MAKIMIVDDNEPIRSLLMALLDILFPDCEVLQASNGEESIALARATEPDVIFMDISMPGMDGIEATKHIKSFLPSARVVMLTGFDDIKLRRDAESAGASYYLLKQLIHKELKPLLKRLLKNEDLAI
ncbi:MAG: response regulator transcription factor [Syntrophorhabdaceae bacterium]|nr:response regulator transcription factor [Syntrophorhabdaceae bacterium]MDD5242746.1 response regulator transcription factor [Syntrophorhabdaceae bacterium]